jgi:hypothetical protein
VRRLALCRRSGEGLTDMGPLVPRLLAHMPSIVKRHELAQLFQSTAAAFQCDMPRLSGLSREQCLREYARFTADRAEKVLRSGSDISEVRERLYRNAYHLGRTPGRLLRVRSVEDVMALAQFLYGILDIEFYGSGSGEITISRCYFSSFYSPAVCQVMSAMDRGLLAGLAGAGDLVFTQRITEGRPCCRGRFTLAASPSSASL